MAQNWYELSHFHKSESFSHPQLPWGSRSALPCAGSWRRSTASCSAWPAPPWRGWTSIPLGTICTAWWWCCTHWRWPGRTRWPRWRSPCPWALIYVRVSLEICALKVALWNLNLGFQNQNLPSTDQRKQWGNSVNSCAVIRCEKGVVLCLLPPSRDWPSVGRKTSVKFKCCFYFIISYCVAVTLYHSHCVLVWILVQ